MQASYNGIAVPVDGKAIEYSNGKLRFPTIRLSLSLKAMERDGISGRIRSGCSTRL